MRNRRSQWKKSHSSVPNIFGPGRQFKESDGETKETVEDCWSYVGHSKQISEHSRTEIGPMRLTDSGLDWLEKTHMRLAIGEPKKGSSRVRLTMWSDYQQT